MFLRHLRSNYPTERRYPSRLLDRGQHLQPEALVPRDFHDAQILCMAYQGLLTLLTRFHEEWTNGKIDKSRVFIVRYDRMMADFDGLMDEMCEFLGHEMTPKLRATIKQKADKQRAYKSEHKYDLSKFGLDEERVRRDCQFFYDTFLPPLESVRPPAEPEAQRPVA